MNRRLVAAVLVAGVALALFAVSAQAQNSLGLGNPEQAIKPEGVFAPLLFWISQQQQGFYALMRDALRGMKQDGSHAWVLIGVSFLYGIFHAAGPGHGKAVISSYMLANEQAARRGIALSFISAFAQAATAILLIGALTLFLRGAGLRQQNVTQMLEIASYAGVTALGAWLLWRKLFGGGHTHNHAIGQVHAHGRSHDAGHSHDHHHGHDHTHKHDHGHGHDHTHHHGHSHAATLEVCDSCGHSHAPDPAILEGKVGMREAWTAIAAVGLRPCSGALIVLTFAFLNGLYAAGIASTLAMALGTGITVGALASLAVWSKDLAVRYSGSAVAGDRVHRIIEIAGAAFVFLIGLTLLSASLYG